MLVSYTFNENKAEEALALLREIRSKINPTLDNQGDTAHVQTKCDQLEALIKDARVVTEDEPPAEEETE